MNGHPILLLSPGIFARSVFNGPILCRRKIVYCVKKSIKKFVGGGLVGFMCFTMAPAVMAAPVTGAIYYGCQRHFVDASIYEAKEDVYLTPPQ